MDYRELKKYRQENTRYKKDNEYNFPVLITYNKYTDNGPTYEQETRYAKPEELDQLILVKCIDCGRYMDGGTYAGNPNLQRCYRCKKEHDIREIFELLDRIEGHKH